MLTVSCREVGIDCDYVCEGETEGIFTPTSAITAISKIGKIIFIISLYPSIFILFGFDYYSHN
jgi:hypothetical protein